jgi:hypothetical protein
MTSTLPASRRSALRGFFASVLLLAACTIPVTTYDAVTFDRLCDLKVECLDVLERLGTSPSVDRDAAAEIHRVRLGVRKLVTREESKGSDNAETTAQMKKLQELFEDDLTEFFQGNVDGRLGTGYAAEARRELAEAFDIAIATEALKNKERS